MSTGKVLLCPEDRKPCDCSGERDAGGILKCPRAGSLLPTEAKVLDLARFEYIPERFIQTDNVLDLPGYAGGMKQSIHLNSVGMAEFIGSIHDLLAEVRRLRALEVEP